MSVVGGTSGLAVFPFLLHGFIDLRSILSNGSESLAVSVSGFLYLVCIMLSRLCISFVSSLVSRGT